jgi:hypothetical protein
MFTYSHVALSDEALEILLPNNEIVVLCRNKAALAVICLLLGTLQEATRRTGETEFYFRCILLQFKRA